MPDTRRQTIIIAVLIVLIAVAAVFARQFNREVENAIADASDLTETATTIQQLRVTYENEKNVIKQQLEEQSVDENLTSEERAKAQDKLMTLYDKGDKENAVENRLLEQGFEDALCMYGDKSIEVYVKGSEELTSEQTAKIMEIVVDETKISPKNVYIRDGN